VIARFGGDEFTMLIDYLRSAADATEAAQRIATALAEPYRIGGRTVHVSASIGIAVSVDGADDAEALISRADAAQYRAKQAGRNRIETFDSQLLDSLTRRLDDEQQLREALASGAIVAWYQPVVDLHTGRIVGAEALARWQHPTRGVLDAFHFVPLAEETGLVLALDDQVVTHAVTTRADLARNGLAAGSFRTWMNVSTMQFTRSNPHEQLTRFLEEAGCAPTLVGVEITETAVLDNVEAAAVQIDAARSQGVKVALDDFGVGHSSLTLLRSLPIDAVKIDRSFVRDITRSARDAAIVESVVQLATKLGIEVVAEGVETPEQARLLRELGCGRAQGWLWAKALPAAALAERLRGERHTPVLAES
jgi:predicted signal transduction protein with EAL and GGDEF domain